MSRINLHRQDPLARPTAKRIKFLYWIYLIHFNRLNEFVKLLSFRPQPTAKRIEFF